MITVKGDWHSSVMVNDKKKTVKVSIFIKFNKNLKILFILLHGQGSKSATKTEMTKVIFLKIKVVLHFAT